MKSISVWIVRLAVCAVLTGITVTAQTATSGIVLGSLKDANGAAVSSAKVELVDDTTGASMSATVTEVGQYVFTTVLPGTYTLKVSASGFKQAVVNQVKVEVAKSTSL